MQNSARQQPVVKKILLILSPVLFLALAEIVLRIVNYGGARTLVIERAIDGRKVYALNGNVTRRYFTHKGLAPAVYTEQTFERKKSDKTYRIFCLGGSATYGHPYPPNVNFPVFLKQRLQTLFPERRFEVINAGMAGASSYVVVDFVKELVNYEPDLFLLNIGHDEFYGALGAASTEGFGTSRRLIKLDLLLQRYKAYLLVKDLLRGLASLRGDDDDQNKDAPSPMAKMIGKYNLPIASKEHQFAIQSFIDNTLEIIDAAQRRRVKILVSTLACNLKDQPPFETVLMPSAKQHTWENYVEQGEGHRAKGDSAKAAFLYQRAAEVFTESADAHFILAHRYLALGAREPARRHFEEALDLDLMPLRARPEFSRALLAICVDKGVPVVPVQEIFEMNSKDGIPGNEVFMDHVNPNQLGYFLMAKLFCVVMYENDCISPKASWNLSRNLKDEVFSKMAAITPLDVGIGTMRIEMMKKTWPFRQQSLPDSLRLPMLATVIDSITYNHVSGKIDWATAHLHVGKYLANHGQYEAAANEYKAVLGVAPAHLNAHLGIAELYVLQKEFEGARSWLEAAMKLHPDSPYPPARLGYVALAKRDHLNAINFFEHARVLQKAGKVMPEDEFLEVEFYLAAAYSFAGEPLKAKTLLQQILKQKPAYAEAQQLLDQL